MRELLFIIGGVFIIASICLGIKPKIRTLAPEDTMAYIRVDLASTTKPWQESKYEEVPYGGTFELVPKPGVKVIAVNVSFDENYKNRDKE